MPARQVPGEQLPPFIYIFGENKRDTMALLNEKMQKEFRKGKAADAKRMIDNLVNAPNQSHALTACQAVQSLAIQIFESFKGYVDDKYIDKPEQVES